MNPSEFRNGTAVWRICFGLTFPICSYRRYLKNWFLLPALQNACIR